VLPILERWLDYASQELHRFWIHFLVVELLLNEVEVFLGGGFFIFAIPELTSSSLASFSFGVVLDRRNEETCTNLLLYQATLVMSGQSE
jgi:hypothetical protein